MSWLDPELDLRTLLSDGAVDKLCYQKKVFGSINGVNATFKTFENRIVDASLLVYVDDVSVSIVSTDFIVGTFNVTAPPPSNSVVRATYYWQYFTDAELATFLIFASSSVGNGIDATTVSSDLIPAAIHYAAGKAYEKLASRAMEPISTEYLLEEIGQKTSLPVERSRQWKSMSDNMYATAKRLMDEVYTAFGKREQPAYGTIQGNQLHYSPQR